MTDTTKDAGSTRLEIPQDQRSPRVTACYTVLDLFSGIGGFSLGLESTGGFKTIAFCEINIFCRNVLAKHWPSVPIFNDVRLSLR